MGVRKKVVIIILLVIGVIFWLLVQPTLSQESNKIYSNKFNSQLIEYLQNNSVKIQPASRTSNIFSVSNSVEPKIPIIVSLYNQNQVNKTYRELIGFGANIKFSYQLINAIAADVPVSALQSLAVNDNIKGIYLDRKIQIEPKNASYEQSIYEDYKDEINSIKLSLIENVSFPFLNESTTYIGAPYVWNKGIDGTGTKIAILDTGIDDTHQDLRGKVIAKRDFTLFDNELKTEDGHGHGTHVAGIAAGTGAASMKWIQTSSTDTSELSNLPYYPNVYHIGKEKLQIEEGNISEDYNILIVQNIPSDGESILNGTWPDNYFDFETNSISNDWRTNDFRYNNETMKFYGGYHWYSILDIGDVDLESSNCPEPEYYWQVYNSSENTILNRTYCIYTSKNNYVKIKINEIGPNHVKFNYKWQSTTPPIIFFDKDGNFNTKGDQYFSSNGDHIKKSQKKCYDWGYCYNYLSPLMTYNLTSNLNSIGILMDFNWDGIPDYMRGVAPGAKLVNGKVLSDQGYGYDSGIIAGIEWAVLNKVDVISMSLGDWMNICDGNDPVSEAVKKASDMNITMVIAAANWGWWGRETLGSPGCADKIITVGASTKSYYYNSEMAGFSSQGPSADGRIKPEILAPGVGIIAPRANNTMIGYSPLSGYVIASGTSMATPHVAGSIALLKQANPSLTPKQIKEILMNTAVDIKGESVFRQGAGIVDVERAYFESAYYDVLNSKASPSELNIVVNNKETKRINLNTIDYYESSVAAYKDELNETNKNFSGIVNQTKGFYYNFTIQENALTFNINISWPNKSNDVDMSLKSPSSYYYYSGLGGRNYETITLENPEAGNWSLYVYPWWVGETVKVNGSYSLRGLVNWNWFSYDYNTNQLEIKPNINESGLYAGKLFLKDKWNLTYAMVPTSIILSEKIDFKNKITHSNKIDPCNKDSFGSQGWESSENSQESYVNIDGYFCNELQRKAYSFTIANNVPYFYVSTKWWNPQSYNYGDMRMFLYEPNGNLYSSADDWGNYESIYVKNPIPGNWTVVFQNEYLPEDGMIFSGEIVIPNLVFNPEALYLEIKKGEKKSSIINITNILDYDLDVSIEKNIWNETPINIKPSSEIDELLAPFSKSYLYYNFYVSSEYIGENNYLKSSYLIKEGAVVYNIEYYLFDADGKFVDSGYIYYPDVESSIYHYINPESKSGNWTLVVSVDGFNYEEVPLNVSMGLLKKSEWLWADVKKPDSFFKGTNNIHLNISVPNDISNDDKIAMLSLTGGWWKGTLGDREFYMPLSVTYPVFMKVINPICSKDSDCGTNGFIGNNQCQENLIYQNYINFTCVEPGTSSSYCTNTTTPKAATDCGSDFCTNYSDNYCKGNDIYKKRTCYNKGCSQGSCFSNPSIEETLVKDCDFGCGNAQCINTKIISPNVNEIYATKKILIEIISLSKLKTLGYFDNFAKTRKEINLCKNCKTINKIVTFSDGNKSITIKSLDSEDNVLETNITFIVDSKFPQISNTRPSSRKYTNGSDFYIKYTEDNCQMLKILINSQEIFSNQCASGKNVEKIIPLDISSFNGLEVEYQFIIIDIANNTDESRPTKIKVDTTIPEIKDFKISIDGKYVYFNMTILNEDKNSFNKVEYNDNPNSRWNSLCTSLKNNNCYKKVSFKAGNHDIIIKASDEARNFIETTARFDII